MNKPPFTVLPIDSIVPSKTNPRREFGAEALSELAQSIAKVGILQPLVVRNTATAEWTLVCGERRWRAARAAGLQEVPAIVRDITDTEALELQITENLQREDISAIEEAEGFRRLIEVGSYTPDTLAARLGKSRSHVFSRLRLCRLSEAVREAMDDGKIEASTAELLAKFHDHDLQREALKEVLEQHGDWRGDDTHPVPFRRAKAILKDFYPDLSDAPWKTTDDLLPGGACDTCPKYSANMPDLPPAAQGLCCTDRRCFQERIAAVRIRKITELQEEGKSTLANIQAHDKAFYPGDEDHLRHDCGLVKGGDRCWEAKKNGETYAGLAKRLKIEPVALVGPRGRVIQTFKATEVCAAAKKAGLLTSFGSHGKEPKERAEVIAENRKRRFVTEVLFKKLLEAVEASRPIDTLKAVLVSDQLPYTFRQAINDALGLKQGPEALQRILDIDECSTLQRLLVVGLIGRFDPLYSGEVLEELARAFDLAPKVILEEAAAEHANGEPPAKTTAASSKPRLSEATKKRIAAAAKDRWNKAGQPKSKKGAK